MGATRFQTAVKVVVPAAFSGIASAYILGISRAVGETMIVAIAAGMQPNLTFDPLEPAATITAYIVQVALGDLPHGSIGYQTIFAAGPDAVADDAGLQHRRLHAAQDASARPTDDADLKHDHRRARKRWDSIFALFGMLALMIGVLTFAALFVDLALDGVGRLSWEFFTNFPVAPAGEAGILSAWVGTTLVMLVTASRRAARRRRRHLPRGVRARRTG